MVCINEKRLLNGSKMRKKRFCCRAHETIEHVMRNAERNVLNDTLVRSYRKVMLSIIA